LIKKYEHREGRGMMVKFDKNKNLKRNFRVIRAKVLNEKEAGKDKKDSIAHTRSFIRHDSEKLAKILMILLEIKDYENIIKEIA